MSLALLILCAPFLSAPAVRPCTPGCGDPVTVQSASTMHEPRGKIAWFAGTYEQLLAEASGTKRIVFLDFYARTNAYSRKLEKSTYCDPQVLAELRDVLCFSVDADSKENKPLRKRFQVQSAPALVFLDPDGALRDQITGYFAPEPFLREVQRIKAGKGTFSTLRARIQHDGDDLDARWDLACKLRTIGDLYGFEEQVGEIRERDRDRRSIAARRLQLDGLYTSAQAKYDLDPLYAFAAAEKEPVLLYDAWWRIWMLEGEATRSANDPEHSRKHLLRYFAAARQLWPLVPVELHKSLGNNIAWSFYENRAGATRDDLEFALGVAQKAVAAAPDVPYVVDTLACCLFAVGRREEAVAQVRRCIELDPQNLEWRERLALFERQR